MCTLCILQACPNHMLIDGGRVFAYIYLPKDVQMISSIFFSYVLAIPKAGKEVHHLKHTFKQKDSLVCYFEVSLSKLQLCIQVQYVAKNIWTLTCYSHMDF